MQMADDCDENVEAVRRALNNFLTRLARAVLDDVLKPQSNAKAPASIDQHPLGRGASGP
jgi:hypothetical protein